MTDEHWQRTWEIFHRALELEKDARGALLSQECGDDAALRAEVERLLTAHVQAPSLLDHPGELAAAVMGADDLIGQTVGPYRIEAQIGEGGMGVVYRAQQEEPITRTVALKLIQLGMNTREVIARFESERRTLAVLEHPNIARVLDAGATLDGRPYFVMELVEGMPVTRYCDERRLSTAERVTLFGPICRAVHHAHQKGIIHRDLKPSNVLVTEQDGVAVPKVIDFGVARATDREQAEATFFTAHGRLIGTPEYMSPEQAENSQDLDVRTDIYSLGVLLYEVLAGCLPFDPAALRRAAFERIREVLRGEEPPTPSKRISTLGADAAAIASQRRTDPSSLHRTLRGDLDWIVMRAMEKERARRYGAASELATELERHLKHEPVEAGPPSARYRWSKFVRRHRAGVAVALSALVLLIGFAAHATWQTVRTRKALVRAEQEASKAERVVSFLTNLFTVSDPGQALGETLLAREVLDRGAAELASELEDQPEVKASMMGVIGEIYTRLGLLAEAEPLLDQSLALRHSLYSDSHPEITDGTLKLASMHLAKGDYEQSKTLLGARIESLRRLVETPESEIADSLHLLGAVLRDSGALEDGEAALREALAIRQTLSGRQHPDTIDVMSSLGLTLHDLGRNQDAEALLRECVEAGETLLAPDHPDLSIRRGNLGLVLRVLGRFEEAHALFTQVLASHRRVYGDHHAEVASALGNLALVNDDLGHFEAAEEGYEQAVALQQRLFGDSHGHVATALSNLGAFYRRQERPRDAERHLRHALAIRRRVVGDHPETATTLNNLGMALTAQQKYDEALDIQNEALAVRRRVQGDEHPDVALTLNNIGLIYHRQGSLEQAEDYYLRAFALLEQSLGASHPNLASMLRNLGFVSLGRGSLDDAVERFRRATSIARAAFGDDHPQLGDTLGNLGAALAEHDRPAEAESILAEALAIQLAHRAPDAWQLSTVRMHQGVVLAALDRYPEAEELLQQALDGFEAIRGTPRDRTLQTLEALVSLYDDWGRPDQAATMRARLAEEQAANQASSAGSP